MNYFLPFLAVVLGWSVVTFLKPASQRYTKLLLSFSGAYLLALTVFVLIPEVYHQHDHSLDFKYIGLCIIVVVLLQIFSGALTYCPYSFPAIAIYQP